MPSQGGTLDHEALDHEGRGGRRGGHGNAYQRTSQPGRPQPLVALTPSPLPLRQERGGNASAKLRTSAITQPLRGLSRCFAPFVIQTCLLLLAACGQAETGSALPPTPAATASATAPEATPVMTASATASPAPTAT